MRVRYAQRAARDLRAATRYLLDRNPGAAKSQILTIRRAVASLTNHPNMGRAGRVEGTRELVITGTPYIAAYAVRDAEIVILAILHGARRWPDRFEQS